MKKKKFMTIYLREDEWNYIKSLTKEDEELLEKSLSNCKAMGRKNPKWEKQYSFIYHFNHVAIDNIEELARKEERRRKRDKSKQKKD